MTLGSKVPLWPVRSQCKIFFTQATTSWEEGLAGLSRLMHPYLSFILQINSYEIYSLIGRFKGELPTGIGV